MATTWALSSRSPRRLTTRTRSPSSIPSFGCEARVHLDKWFRLLRDEWTDPPGSASPTRTATPPGRGWVRMDRVFLINVFRGWSILDGMKPGSTIRMRKATSLEQAWRAGMVDGRTRPEDAQLLIDLFVGDARIVGHTTR